MPLITSCCGNERLKRLTVYTYIYLSSLAFLQPCHVVYTDFRPTPLQHYIYPAGGDGLFLVEDEKVCVEIMVSK